MTKLERIALKYRINLAEPQLDQQSVTTLTAVPVQPASKPQRQSEYERLKMEFQLAKQRLQDFVTRDKQQQMAARRARVH